MNTEQIPYDTLPILYAILQNVMYERGVNYSLLFYFVGLMRINP
jgi:hypothetical protein